MENKAHVKIFLVDDDLFCLSIYRQHLNNLGYENISTFDNGISCVNSLSQQPQVIFLDHSMEGVTGLEVLKKIKSFSPDIYVIFISGQEDAETAISSLRYGAFDYIIKGETDLHHIKKVLERIGGIKEVLKDAKPKFAGRQMSSI